MFSMLNLTWVTFHSSYDFGYMVKVLTGRKLPNDLDVFKAVVFELFRSYVYDMKRMIKFCRGINVRGLEKLAKNLKVDRVAVREIGEKFEG
ncbi:uncharacterized protein DS421_15g503130 [Arachis hypogaea]|nr:uncharacterized protein DS421_15g503130 [Arachis hypogaea]